MKKGAKSQSRKKKCLVSFSFCGFEVKALMLMNCNTVCVQWYVLMYCTTFMRFVRFTVRDTVTKVMFVVSHARNTITNSMPSSKNCCFVNSTIDLHYYASCM